MSTRCACTYVCMCECTPPLYAIAVFEYACVCACVRESLWISHVRIWPYVWEQMFAAKRKRKHKANEWKKLTIESTFPLSPPFSHSLSLRPFSHILCVFPQWQQLPCTIFFLHCVCVYVYRLKTGKVVSFRLRFLLLLFNSTAYCDVMVCYYYFYIYATGNPSILFSFPCKTYHHQTTYYTHNNRISKREIHMCEC